MSEPTDHAVMAEALDESLVKDQASIVVRLRDLAASIEKMSVGLYDDEGRSQYVNTLSDRLGALEGVYHTAFRMAHTAARADVHRAVGQQAPAPTTGPGGN